MATPKENLLSLGNLTGINRDTFNTFTNRRERSPTRSSTKTLILQGDSPTQRLRRVMHLQQRWHELKDRECAAQHRNQQLLQQFEDAQESLRDMMARTAAMKTIRMEYERYLEESSPRWQQQLKEKTQAAQKKRTEEYLKMHLENTGTQEATSSVAQPWHSQGSNNNPQASSPQVYSLNSHAEASQFPCVHSSWLTQSQAQAARFRVRAPYHPQSASQIPPPFLQPPHPYHLQHLSTQHLWPRQNPPGWASSQPEYPYHWGSGTAEMASGSGTPWGHLYMGEPPPAKVEVHAGREGSETRTTHSSRTESCNGIGYQELDVKPVRLSSGHAESSESGRDSSQARRERKKKKGRQQRSSSERERCTSQESSRASIAIVIASATMAKASQSHTSSEKTSTSSRKLEKKVADESLMTEKAAKGSSSSSSSSKGSGRESSNQKRQSAGEESSSASEESRSENALNKRSVSNRYESGSPEDKTINLQHENGLGFELEEEESSSSEQSGKEGNVEEQKGRQKELGDEEEEAEEDGNQDIDVGDEEEVSIGKNTADEEEETGEEDEQSDEDQQGEEERIDRRQDPNSSHNEVDEGESEGSEEKVEEGEDDEEEEDGDEEEKEQMSDKVVEPEERDSEDSIISPQESRQRKIHVIPEEDSQEDEEEEQSKAGSSGDDDNSEDFRDEDIEELLAPQTPVNDTKKEEHKTKDKPKGLCDTVGIFQVEKDLSTHMDQQSDSDEFDHFYD